MLSKFFIDRPIFATVLSVLIFLAGSLSVVTLPVSQYPQVTPPTIQIDCNYPGANAKVVADTGLDAAVQAAACGSIPRAPLKWLP